MLEQIKNLDIAVLL